MTPLWVGTALAGCPHVPGIGSNARAQPMRGCDDLSRTLVGAVERCVTVDTNDQKEFVQVAFGGAPLPTITLDSEVFLVSWDYSPYSMPPYIRYYWFAAAEELLNGMAPSVTAPRPCIRTLSVQSSQVPGSPDALRSAAVWLRGASCASLRSVESSGDTSVDRDHVGAPADWAQVVDAVPIVVKSKRPVSAVPGLIVVTCFVDPNDTELSRSIAECSDVALNVRFIATRVEPTVSWSSWVDVQEQLFFADSIQISFRIDPAASIVPR
ncbi:MAG: hypothetical protein ABMA64_40125 [Myxococcota bacterium]